MKVKPTKTNIKSIIDKANRFNAIFNNALICCVPISEVYKDEQSKLSKTIVVGEDYKAFIDESVLFKALGL